ncbi:MAG: helix-turn-helix domain-containing protein [Gammaproteobacteria bacterium]
MKKRNLFEELEQGLKEIQEYNKGQITLRTYSLSEKEKPEISPEKIREVRENLHLSRSVFALKLRVPLRTLEKWEQGLMKPNVQASALLLMIRKYPDTLDRLSKI